MGDKITKKDLAGAYVNLVAKFSAYKIQNNLKSKVDELNDATARTVYATTILCETLGNIYGVDMESILNAYNEI